MTVQPAPGHPDEASPGPANSTASGAPRGARAARSSRDFSSLASGRWTPLQHCVQELIRGCFRCISRVRIEGLENVPPTGPVLMVVNHLNMLDVPLFFSILPRRCAVFVGHNWQRIPVINWFLEQVMTAVYVNRGITDRKAIRGALDVLHAGGLLAMAPEGTFSNTGGLMRGKSGAAFLAARSGATVLPVVAFGHDEALSCWKRLRRVPIRVRIGPAFRLPEAVSGSEGLEQQTDAIMLSMARLLPPPYRGVYADQIAAETAAGDLEG